LGRSCLYERAHFFGSLADDGGLDAQCDWTTILAGSLNSLRSLAKPAIKNSVARANSRGLTFARRSNLHESR
jgi:hypothetical protein